MIALSIFSSRILKHVFISIILVQAPYFYKNSTSIGMRVRVSLRCPFYCCRVIMCNDFRTFHSWTHKIIVLYPDAIFQDFYLFEVCKLFVFCFYFRKQLFTMVPRNSNSQNIWKDTRDGVFCGKRELRTIFLLVVMWNISEQLFSRTASGCCLKHFVGHIAMISKYFTILINLK